MLWLRSGCQQNYNAWQSSFYVQTWNNLELFFSSLYTPHTALRIHPPPPHTHSLFCRACGCYWIIMLPWQQWPNRVYLFFLSLCCCFYIISGIVDEETSSSTLVLILDFLLLHQNTQHREVPERITHKYWFMLCLHYQGNKFPFYWISLTSSCRLCNRHAHTRAVRNLHFIN